MIIHKEGFKILLVTLFIFVCVNAFAIYYDYLLFGVILLISLLVFGFMLFFFRSPNIKKEKVKNCIISPADGKIIAIDKVYEDIYFKDTVIKVSIFLSALNVHVIRYPISGLVEFIKYYKGKYLLAWHPKSSQMNENNVVVINNNTFGEVMFKKIAGFVARRIKSYSKLNSNVLQGDEAGFIKFGSRVDIFFPLEWKLLIDKDQKVKGAKTKIAIKK